MSMKNPVVLRRAQTPLPRHRNPQTLTPLRHLLHLLARLLPEPVRADLPGRRQARALQRQVRRRTDGRHVRAPLGRRGRGGDRV